MHRLQGVRTGIALQKPGSYYHLHTRSSKEEWLTNYLHHLQHKVCPRCKASVCKKCVTKRKYPLPGWKDKRAVCLLCLPEVDKTFE